MGPVLSMRRGGIAGLVSAHFLHGNGNVPVSVGGKRVVRIVVSVCISVLVQ